MTVYVTNKESAIRHCIQDQHTSAFNILGLKHLDFKLLLIVVEVIISLFHTGQCLYLNISSRCKGI